MVDKKKNHYTCFILQAQTHLGDMKFDLFKAQKMVPVLFWMQALMMNETYKFWSDTLCHNVHFRESLAYLKNKIQMLKRVSWKRITNVK